MVLVCVCDVCHACMCIWALSVLLWGMDYCVYCFIRCVCALSHCLGGLIRVVTGELEVPVKAQMGSTSTCSGMTCSVREAGY